tara:strand:+ start:341 stop:964 length:624 start_codon:yes stop_codon:yes gene_type:complete
MVLIKNRYGYIFDPETMYQPEIDPALPYYDEGLSRFYRDGSVRTLYPDWELDQESVKGWNVYQQAGGGFRAYRKTAQHFWPHRPKGLSVVDHINRDRGDDSWGNLRLVNASLNSLNQYREGTKGYRYESSAWLKKVNACRARQGKPPIYLPGPPRNQYIAVLTYRGDTVELGAFDTPEAATKCYLASKEPFIQNELRRLWTEFLCAS